MKKITTLFTILMISGLCFGQQLYFQHHPESAIVCENSNHEFYVLTDTAGFQGAPMTYSWYFNESGSWEEVATGEHYVVAETMLKVLSIPVDFDALQYRCVVRIGDDTFESNPAVMSVNTSPVIAFEQANHCFGDVTNFQNTTNESASFQSWHWDFGDDVCPDSSLLANASHYFCHPGDFTVKLTGVDPNGCSSTTSQTVEILALPKPWIEGPEIACSFQQNIKFFSSGTFVDYNWSLVGEDSPCAFSSGNAFEVLLDCDKTYTPKQFEVELSVTDENGCSGVERSEFLILTYQSPRDGKLIQKPDNSQMLVCLLENPENMDYKWAVTVKGHPEDTISKYSTDVNFLLLNNPVNTVEFEYGVKVINTGENNCSSSFYLNEDENNIDASKKDSHIVK